MAVDVAVAVAMAIDRWISAGFKAAASFKGIRTMLHLTT